MVTRSRHTNFIQHNQRKVMLSHAIIHAPNRKTPNRTATFDRTTIHKNANHWTQIYSHPKIDEMIVSAAPQCHRLKQR
jgi:hypothetical protein